MSSTKLNIDGIMLFEQPFARVPYENYRKVFRTTQKNIERELGAVQTVANELSRRAKSGMQTPPDAEKSIDGMIGRVENLKRKVRLTSVGLGAFPNPPPATALRLTDHRKKPDTRRYARATAPSCHRRSPSE